MILPRTNNGMQFVYSIICNFNGIVLFRSSNICVIFKVDYLKECLTRKNSSESNIASCNSSEIFGTYISVPGPGLNLKKLIQSHHSQQKEHRV